MLIGRAGIARLIPHDGAMCLLDGVLSWDAAGIACTASSHNAADNPLRRDGRLGILCGVEYAAQAMAVHGALMIRADRGGAGGVGLPDAVAGGVAARDTFGSAAGFLASLRTVEIHTDRLDQLTGALIVDAARLHSAPNGAIYSFALRDGDRILLSGRAAVAFRHA